MAFRFKSQVLFVRADTTIRDVIALMVERGTGSILIVSPDHRQKLIGIFTERDLLRKVNQLQNGENWDKTIWTIATQTVMTLPLSRIDEAPELMLLHNFRHLPIVEDGTQNTENPRVIGVISMRDLFQLFVDKAEGTPGWIQSLFHLKIDEEKKEPPLFTLLGQPLNGFPDDLPAILAGVLGARTERVAVTDFIARVSGAGANDTDVLLLDLELPETATWLQYLKTLGAGAKLPFTAILIDPSRYPPHTLEAIYKLERPGQIAVFSKPLNLLEFAQKLNSEISARLAGSRAQ